MKRNTLMKVLVITQYFYPENFKSNDMAFELVRRGYDVDALVGIPNYPEGRVYPGYGCFRRRKEVVNGVNVYRTLQISRGKSAIRLVVNYLSYAISACMDVFFFYVWKQYDAILVYEVSPIFQAIPAILLKIMRKIPVYLWVLDIWPDALESSGNIHNKMVLHGVDCIVKWVYRNSDKILLSSERFKDMVITKGDVRDRLVYFPNWSEDLEQVSSSYDIPELPDGFKIMMAGNLGKVQDLPAVGKAMLLTHKNKEVKWIFIGDGSYKAWLDEFIKENDLGDVAFTFGRFPGIAMPSFYKKADALLVTLQGHYPQLRKVVPARLQSYMSAGKPVLAMIGEGGTDIINEAQCGYAVDAGDSKALADVILGKVMQNRAAFQALGQNGRAFYEKTFTKEKCIDHLCRIINKEDVSKV